jgi:hypothetical protein
MSKLYNLIEGQVNTLLRFFMETDEGQIRYTDLLSGPKQIKAFIAIISAVVFGMITILFGLYLWNQGLHPVFPNVIAPIGKESYPQSENPFFQLIVTLVSLAFII